MATDVIFVYVTCADLAEAEAISRALVEEEIAACANIFPQMRSIYRWQGKVQTADEAVAVLKTKRSLFEKLKHRVEQLHSYDVPCVVSFAVEDGNEAWLEWVGRNTA